MCTVPYVHILFNEMNSIKYEKEQIRFRVNCHLTRWLRNVFSDNYAIEYLLAQLVILT